MNTKPLKRFCVGGPAYGLNVSADQYVDHGTRLLRTTDIGPDGRLGSLESAVYLAPGRVPAEALLRSGDLLLSRSGTLGRALLVPEAAEEITYAGYLVRFRPATNAHPRYLWYCAQSQVMQDAIGADAIQSTIGNFNGERYANLSLPTWPLDEQQAIADYLDRETARLDALIEGRRRMLDLLDERLRASREQLIWLDGSYPVKALRRVCPLIKDGTHQPPTRVTSGYPLLSVRNLQRGRLELRDDDSLVSEVDYRGLTKSWRVQANDIALAIVGATLGKVGIVGDLPGVALQRSLAVLRPHRNICEARYLYHALCTSSFQAALWSSVAFSAQPGVYLGVVASIGIPIPSIRTQKEIVRDLDATQRWRDSTARAIERQASVLRERRQALITAAVTGQVEVPVAA